MEMTEKSYYINYLAYPLQFFGLLTSAKDTRVASTQPMSRLFVKSD